MASAGTNSCLFCQVRKTMGAVGTSSHSALTTDGEFIISVMTTHWCASWTKCIDFVSNPSRMIHLWVTCLSCRKLQSSSKHSRDKFVMIIVCFAVRMPCNFCSKTQTKQAPLYYSSETAAKTYPTCSNASIVEDSTSVCSEYSGKIKISKTGSQTSHF